MRNITETGQPRTVTLPTMLRHLKYFMLSMASILLSLIFQVAEYQLLTLAIITGIKWIADNKNVGIIIIERGWTQW